MICDFIFSKVPFPLLTWLLMSCQGISAQKTMNEYQESVWNFYSQLLSNDTAKVICAPFTPHQITDRNSITFDYSADSIKKVITKAKVLDEGNEMCVLVQLEFPNKKLVFVEVSKDSDYDINCFYLPDGSNMEAPTVFMKRPAMMNEETLVHRLPNESSETIRLVKKDELFFFTPNSSTDWVKIYNSFEDEEPIGYLRKTGFIFFEDFPDNIKKEVVQQLSPSC